tara:strand:- start:907 stop:1173 length:267 start_codon:yes stop_codon:yes gene_type:complete
MINKPVNTLNRKEMKEYILQLQQFIKTEQDNGKDIDTILDETDIFDQFEEILPDNEFPIFVITILNGFQSEVIINKLINTIESSIENK